VAVSATVRYDAHGEWFLQSIDAVMTAPTPGHQAERPRCGNCYGPRPRPPCSAEARRGTLRCKHRSGPDDEYSPKSTVVDPISFKLLDDGRLAIRISLTSDNNFEDQNRLYVVIEPLIDPLAPPKCWTTGCGGSESPSHDGPFLL
jgi:hypothetical protein